MKKLTGKVHSFESFGTVDGPGIRFVVFMQGCPLRCRYCHNPDTWYLKDTQYEFSIDEVVDELKKYKNFFRNGGGLTISGGEPFMQADFVKELLKRAKEEGIHTAVDTSGCILNEKVKESLKYIDLILLDIKCMDEHEYQDLTGGSLLTTLEFAKYLSLMKKTIWLRHVLVPGVTDRDEFLEHLADFAKDLKNVERVEILPFHKMGEHKWESLGREYTLADTKEPTRERVENAKSIFRSRGLNVI